MSEKESEADIEPRPCIVLAKNTLLDLRLGHVPRGSIGLLGGEVRQKLFDRRQFSSAPSGFWSSPSVDEPWKPEIGGTNWFFSAGEAADLAWDWELNQLARRLEELCANSVFGCADASD